MDATAITELDETARQLLELAKKHPISQSGLPSSVLETMIAHPPGPIPETYQERGVRTVQDVGSRYLQRAIELGMVKPGWSLESLIQQAIETHGWLEAIIWGIKGAGKSNRMLAMGYAVYGDWDAVLRHIVFKPTDLAMRIVEAAKAGKRIPWLGFDDINAFLPKTLYHTNRWLYQKLSSAWPLTRAMINVFACTLPVKEELANFLLRDMTTEILISGRQRYEVEHWVWDLNLENPFKSRKFPIYQAHKTFDVHEVPIEVWGKYWEAKLGVTVPAMLEFAEGMRGLSEQESKKKAEKQAHDFKKQKQDEVTHWSAKVSTPEQKSAIEMMKKAIADS